MPWLITDKKGLADKTLAVEEKREADASARSMNSQIAGSGRRIWQQVSSYALLIFLSTFWGLAFVAIRRVVSELSPVNLALLRWSLASAGFLAIVPFIGKPKTKLERGDLPRLLIIALLTVPSYHLALNFAETAVTSGVAGFITSLGPVFIAVLSTIFLKEKIKGRLLLALFLGIAGATVLSLPNINFGSNGSIVGPLEVVLASLSFAIFSVLSKPLVHKYGSVSVTIWSGVMGTVMLLPLLSPSFVSEIVELSLTGWFSVLYLSLLSTVVGYLLFYTLVGREAVSRLSIQMYLIPVVSVVGGVILLQEVLSFYMVLGGAILLFSIALAKMNRR